MTGSAMQLLIDIEKKAQTSSARTHGLRVSHEDFWMVVKALHAKVERDNRCEFVTIETSRGNVRLEAKEQTT